MTGVIITAMLVPEMAVQVVPAQTLFGAAFRPATTETIELPIPAADPLHDRRDLVVGDAGSGHVGLVTGTPAPVPRHPVVGLGKVPLAAVRVSAGTSCILPTDITNVTARGPRETARPTAALPVRKREGAIRAWKEALLTYEAGGPLLMSRFTGVTYALEDTSRCLRPAPAHDAPDPGCRCGFYGMADDLRWEEFPSGISLEVDLSGRVVRHEYGYRAERQRILAVWLSSDCATCSRGTTAVSFDWEPAGPSFRWWHPARSIRLVGTTACDACSQEQRGHGGPVAALRPGEVAQALGTEVRCTPSMGR